MPKIVKWLKGKPSKEGEYRCKFLRLDGKQSLIEFSIIVMINGTTRKTVNIQLITR